MDFERLFHLVEHMYKNPSDNYNMKDGVSLDKKTQIKVLTKAIQSFVHDAASAGPDGKATIQAFSGSTDLPKLTHDVFNVTEAVDNFDLLWQAVYSGIKLMEGQLSWEVSDVSSGVTFDLVPEGGKAKFYGFTGSTETININKYGAGIGVTWEMIHGRKLYRFIEQLKQVRAALHTLWGNTHYGLLAAAALGALVVWQGVATDPVIDRDIATINTGYTTIGNATKDKGYGDTANVVMHLYASPLLTPRINQALRATQSDVVSGRAAGGAGSTASQVIEYPVVAHYTYNSNIPANKALLVLPGHKIQNAMYMQEYALSEENIETLNQIKSYWTAYGATVADTDQTAELSFT